MTCDAEISELVVDYTGYGTCAVPRCSWMDIDVCAEHAELKKVQAVRVVELVNSIEIDWNGKSLEDGAEEARGLVAEIHPELTDTALDALAWLFSFEWR